MNPPTQATALLSSVCVLDVSNVLAGPLCTYLLALAGARVIKVEQPGIGDPTRKLGPDAALHKRGMGLSFLPQNGGKESMTVNLKHPDGQALIRKLLTRCDVFVENFRPGVLQRLGLDYNAVKSCNERLIYCSVSGFGQSGPWARRPAYDHVVQGLAGGMTITGTEETGPIKAGFQFCDTAAALMAAFAITAALSGRAHTGQGAYLDVSMLDTALFTLGWPVGHYLADGTIPRAMGNDNFSGCPSGTFRTRQGLLNLTTNTDQQFARLSELMSRPEWIADPCFSNAEARISNREKMNTLLEAELAKRTAVEWEAALAEAGVPAARVRTIPEILAEEQVRMRGFVQSLGSVTGIGSNVSVPTAGFQVNGDALTVRSVPPNLGTSTKSILAEFGFSENQIADFRSKGVI